MTDAELQTLRTELRIETLEAFVAELTRALAEVNPKLVPVLDERIRLLFWQAKTHKLSDPLESMGERTGALDRLYSRIQSAFDKA